MTQAIGRARRWGQEKLVHVYHFVTTKTIDVDIIEQRNQGKMLVSGALALGGEEGVLEDLGVSQRTLGAKTPLSSSIAKIVFKSSDYE